MSTSVPASAPAPESGADGSPAQQFATSAAAVRANAEAAEHLKDRARQIREAPELHRPRLVLSQHVRGSSLLDKIADGVNQFCGSMYVFIGISSGIILWLILGQVAGFDPVPWPLLLTILNLPQLSIMISLQVSANRAQAASDRRAIADHDTLIALHEMARQQLDILKGQDRILQMLQTFASKDMPGTQREVLDCANKILALVGKEDAAG
ncbi:MAG TPA: hypothetical protein VH637_15540 [Streptosporangiaceae bacterium]|jgi:uncharacterized membrane protein